MTRPRSKQTQAALDDIAAGMSQAAAAKKHCVDQGLLSRMLKPKDPTVSVKLTFDEIVSVSNGDVWNIDLMDKFNDAISKLQGKQ